MDRTEIAALRAAVGRNMVALGRTPRQHLAWTTVVISARVAAVKDDIRTEVARDVDGFRAAWRGTMMRSGTVKRGTRWAGAVEVDLIHPRLAGGARKGGLLAELGVDVAALRPDQRVIVPHAHLVVDDRGHPSREVMMRDLREQWPGPWRIVAKPLHDTGTVGQHLRSLAEYTTKVRLRYCEAWAGRPTKFLVDYEPEWRDYIRNIYAAIGPAGMVISNTKSRAAPAV